MSGKNRVISIKPGAEITPHRDYSFWLPGAQPVGSGSVHDQSGNGRDFAIQTGTTDAEVWASPGFFTTKAAVNGHVLAAPGAGAVDLRSDGFLISFWSNASPPGAQGAYIGQTGSNTARGVRLTIATNGRFIVAVDDASGISKNTGFMSPTKALDGGLHFFAIAIDGAGAAAYIWRDSEIVESKSFPALSGSTLDTEFGFGFGSNASATSSIALPVRDAHCLVCSGGLPGEIGSVVDWIRTHPFQPLPAGFY